MGGILASEQAAYFRVQAQADQTPLTRVEIIRGALADGELQESVVEVWSNKTGAADLCVTWEDDAHDPKTPAFWYARVLEAPTPRWSAFRCQREGRCDEFAAAERWIQERAWTSPVWQLPGRAR